MNDQSQEVATTIEDRIEGRIDKSVTGALAVSDRAGGLVFANAGEAMEMAKLLAISGVAVPKHLRGNPGACLAIVIQSIEWRLSPYAVANKSYSVNDRLAYESQLIQAVILQRAPIIGRFKVEYDGEGPSRRCRVWAKLKDTGEIVEYTSPTIATIPVKNSPLWKGDPDQQLFYYSGRALCRRHFPDVLLGVYAREELDERDPEDARDITPTRSLSDKLDALASGGDAHTAAEPMAPLAAEAFEKAEKAKKTRKASAPKAEEAAGADAGNKAGAQPSPQADASAAASEQQTAADAPMAAAKSAAAAEPSPAAAAAPKAMTEAHRTGLRRMHTDIMAKAMGRKRAQEFFDAFVQANELAEGDAAYAAAETVLLAHFKRIAGESSPVEVDAALNKAIAQ